MIPKKKLKESAKIMPETHHFCPIDHLFYIQIRMTIYHKKTKVSLFLNALVEHNINSSFLMVIKYILQQSIIYHHRLVTKIEQETASVNER